MTIRVPLRLESEANARGHWSGKARRAKDARQAVTAAFVDAGARVAVEIVQPKKLGSKVRTRSRWIPLMAGTWLTPPALPLVVFLARIAPRELDGDNLQRSMKAVRDQVAELLAIDDADPRVTWRYEQRRGRVKEYAVEIAIYPRGEQVGGG